MATEERGISPVPFQNREYSMKKHTIGILVATGILMSTSAPARDFHRELSVTVSNLANATYFTPLLVAVHDRHTHLFQLGTEASDHLQAMAEGGDISGLSADVVAAGGQFVADPAEGLLAPGAEATARFDLKGERALSLVAMLLPTNDGFVGLDALEIPRRKGTYVHDLYGYDAGTEANDEIINGGGAPGVPGIPADPGGNGGTGASGAAGPDHNPSVHIHRGVLGDSDPEGGISDLDSSVHRWQNPVARVIIRVQ